MNLITTTGLIAVFDAMAAAIEADKDRLSQLDGVIGDADHGVTMSIGFAAITQTLAEPEMRSADPATVLTTAAKSFLSAVGASSGPLYATAFMRAGAAVKGRAAIDRDSFVAMLAAIAKGIADRGKAERGEKTMLDAWAPAAEAAQAAAAAGRPLLSCLDDAAAAAEAGAEATKKMLATKGRASRLGARVLGHVDPGAASAVTLICAMRDAVAATK